MIDIPSTERPCKQCGVTIMWIRVDDDIARHQGRNWRYAAYDYDTFKPHKHGEAR